MCQLISFNELENISNSLWFITKHIPDDFFSFYEDDGIKIFVAYQFLYLYIGSVLNINLELPSFDFADYMSYDYKFDYFMECIYSIIPNTYLDVYNWNSRCIFLPCYENNLNEIKELFETQDDEFYEHLSLDYCYDANIIVMNNKKIHNFLTQYPEQIEAIIGLLNSNYFGFACFDGLFNNDSCSDSILITKQNIYYAVSLGETFENSILWHEFTTYYIAHSIDEYIDHYVDHIRG